VRNVDFKCIKEETCPCKGKNEEYGNCPTGCGDGSCSDPTNAGVRCFVPCQGKKCFCKKGFVRNEVGVCTAIDKCPARECCIDDLEFSVIDSFNPQQPPVQMRTRNTTPAKEDVVTETAETQPMPPRDALVTARLDASVRRDT
jgi:Trypsin Inhibitor like cysteine rich domain